MHMQHDPYMELVRVIKPFRLLDPESYERQYRRNDGAALAPGFYVVIWPAGTEPGRYSEQVVFRGPYREHGTAEAVLDYIVARKYCSDRPRLTALW
jgi:hypothetical protein